MNKNYFFPVFSKTLCPDGADGSGAPSRFFGTGMWLFFLALGLRLVYIYQSRANPLFGYPLIDASHYDRWATQMAGGQWLWTYVDNYLPIYPAFLAAQKVLWGGAPLVNKLIQSTMGALSVVLMAHIAHTLWNRRVGLVTGLLMAVNWLLIVFESEKYAETVSIFFLSLSLWLLVCCKQKKWALAISGVAFALSAGCRANLFLLGPFIVIWLIVVNRDAPRRALANTILFLLGTILIIAPIACRNYQLTGVPLLRSQAGWSFYSALEPRFGGLHPPAGAMFRKEIRRPFQAGLRTAPAFDRFWFERARGLIRNDTRTVLLNQGRRLLIFLNARQWSQEFDVYAYRDYAGILRLFGPVFWLLIPLGLLGLIQLRNDPPSAGKTLLVLCLLLSAVSIFPFKASDRYRLPCLVLLTPLAAFAFCRLIELARTKHFRRLLAASLWLAVLLVICWPDWADLSARKAARHEYFVGLAYDDAGQDLKAINAYRTSMEKYSWDPDSPYRIGRILMENGRLNEARYYLQIALDREPEFPEALLEMAYLSTINHEYAAAERYLTKCLDLHPQYHDGLLFATFFYRQTGNLEKELACYEKAVAEARCPSVQAGGFADTALERSLRLEELGKTDEAIAQLDEVLKTAGVAGGKKAIAALLAGGISARIPSKTHAAYTYWQALINDCPAHSYPWYTASFMMSAVGESEFKAYLETLDYSGYSVFGYYLLGLKYQRAGRGEDARRAFEESLRLDGSPDQSYLFCAGQRWAREAFDSILRTIPPA